MNTLIINPSRIPDQSVDRENVLCMVRYLNELRNNSGHDEFAICQALMDAVEQDHLPPGVFSVFLSWCDESKVLISCILHESSASIRSAAIKDLGRRLKRPSKQNNSTALGEVLSDTEGLVAILAQSSVADVKLLCGAICNSGRHGRQQQPAYEARQQAVEALLRRLLPAFYGADPSERGVQADKRPLQHIYASMLPACSAEFVEAVLNERDESNPLYRWRNIDRLLRSHRDLLKRLATERILNSQPDADRDATGYVSFFLNHDKNFLLSALRHRADGTITEQRWNAWSNRQATSYTLDLVRRLVKRQPAHKDSTAVQIHDLVQLGLDIRALQSDSSSIYHRRDEVALWDFALEGWKRRPELFQDVLVLGMQLGLATSPGGLPRDYLSIATCPRFPEALRPRLLQLYCLHAVKTEGGLDSFAKAGVDISAEDANLAVLKKMSWPYEIFSHIETQRSVKLLQKLEAVNAECNFLNAPSDKVSILCLREVVGRKNFNVDLLLTLLQRGDTTVLQNARDAVDILRKRAAGATDGAREQGHRAAFAEAAAAYAIATGDLEVYGDTILWQQRFLRDPLTAVRIFGRKAVLTQEGIELLSAIPVPGSSPLDLPTTRDRISKADEILKTFYETYKIAKREPSFQGSAWSSVIALFGEVYTERVRRIGTVRDVQAVVWGGLMSALEWMDFACLNKIQSACTSLINLLGPTHLAAATRDLLRVGAQRRKAQNRTPEDDLLERMSYYALKRLAVDSSMPELASDLVVQTIIDRPDASSWHRQLLSPRFLKRLRASEAHTLLVDLATAIGEKLEEQSYVQIGQQTEPAKNTAPPSKPIVKVTTVKYLAQLLNNAAFIANETAVAVLVELFQTAQHRDIRAATLDSLLGLLAGLCVEAKEAWVDHPIIETIMRALETAVPVIGSINERRLLRPEDWADAEATGNLPDISDGTGVCQTPPLMTKLLFVADGSYPGLEVMKTALVERLILPVLRHSQREHSKWLGLFLAKYKAGFALTAVPVPPVAPSAWIKALTAFYPAILTSSAILEELRAYTAHQTAPDAATVQFNKILRADTELRKRAEVQHWMRVFDNSPADFPQYCTVALIRLVLESPVDFKPAIEIVVQHLCLFLDDYERYANVWDQCLTFLSNGLQLGQDRDRYRQWRETHGHIIARISDEIQARQTRGTQQILPSTTKLRLWLLPFPTTKAAGGDFVRHLGKLVQDILEANESNTLQWAELADDICDVLCRLLLDDVKANVAYDFGKLAETGEDGDLGLAAAESGQARMAKDLIRVKVAMRLFDDCKEEKTVQSLGRERLEEWRACRCATIRESLFRWRGRARIEKG